MFTIVEQIISWGVGLVDKFDYWGIFFTMALESAAIPIPSEVVLPFGGFLASSGHLHFWLVVFTATIANLVGATMIYLVGLFGGRAVLERYGKYVFVSAESISRMDNWLAKYGAHTAFFSRLLPGIRTFSSLIIGAGRVSFGKFFGYTFAGSFLWNLPLAYVGFVAGKNWDFLRPYFQKFELAILAVILIIVILFIFRQIHKFRKLSKHP